MLHWFPMVVWTCFAITFLTSAVSLTIFDHCLLMGSVNHPQIEFLSLLGLIFIRKSVLCIMGKLCIVFFQWPN